MSKKALQQQQTKKKSSFLKMDEFKLLNSQCNHKSRTYCYHNYQTRNLLHKMNRFKFVCNLIILFILNLQFINASSHHHLIGHPQQAPPTSLTIKNNQKYNTTYACEGSQLTINCDQPGSEINVIRSNFGRFSISICNSQGVLDWSVNCFSKNTVELIRRACNGQRQCLLQASTDLFGNPCPSTYKYLEVHYECTSKETSSLSAFNSADQTSMLAPLSATPKLTNNHHVNNVNTNVINSNLNNFINSNNKRNSVPPSIIIPDNPLLKTHHHPNSNKQMPQPSIPLVPIYTTASSINLLLNSNQANKQSNSEKLDNEDLFFNNNNNNNNLPARSTQFSTYNSQSSSVNDSAIASSPSTPKLYCAQVFERGLNWNRTIIESFVTQSCPPGSTGIAQWFCSPATNNQNDQSTIANEPHWMPSQPIFAQCQSSWLTQINRRATSGESALLLSEELSNLIAETNQLYGGDIKGITELMRLLLQPLELMIAQHHQQEQTKISKEMLAVSSLISFIYFNYYYFEFIKYQSPCVDIISKGVILYTNTLLNKLIAY